MRSSLGGVAWHWGGRPRGALDLRIGRPWTWSAKAGIDGSCRSARGVVVHGRPHINGIRTWAASTPRPHQLRSRRLGAGTVACGREGERRRRPEARRLAAGGDAVEGQEAGRRRRCAQGQEGWERAVALPGAGREGRWRRAALGREKASDGLRRGGGLWLGTPPPVACGHGERVDQAVRREMGRWAGGGRSEERRVGKECRN